MGTVGVTHRRRRRRSIDIILRDWHVRPHRRTVNHKSDLDPAKHALLSFCTSGRRKGQNPKKVGLIRSK